METITAFEFLSESFNLDFMTHAEVMLLCTAMDLYAKGKCREQRELCCNEIQDELNNDYQELVRAIRLLVLNAPEPEFKNILAPTQ